ncbi:MAG: cytochrome c biogenesis protein CcsA [Verrucomicrobiaceae bacterium]|nr:cytochrome c biogenesis protein CcsA [Verrucomicrobiaceae bacterium]
MKTLIIAAAIALGVCTLNAEPTLAQLRDPELVNAFATLPVQEAGRIKPLDTVARYRLLRFHGSRVVRFENPETKKADKLSSIEWLLVTWFKPDLAKSLPLFRVDNPAAITEIGGTAKDRMEGVKGKYTYRDIEPHRAKLMELAEEYRNLEPKNRTPIQRMIADLGVNILDYEMIVGHWDSFRSPFGKEPKLPEELAKALPPPHRIPTALPAVLKYVKDHPEAAAPMSNPWMMEFMKGALGGMMSGNQELSYRIFPPKVGATEKWHGPGWIIMEGLQTGEVTADDLAWLADYEKVFQATDDPVKFKAEAIALKSKIESAAAARNEGSTVKLEASYHKADYFYNAMIWFVAAIILLGTSWLIPASKWERWLTWISWAAVLIATAYTLTGITIRCIIMQRGPIATLYETMVFIAGTGALFGIAAELLTRRKLGLFIASLAGAAGLFLSIRFETADAGDTLVQLQAVLITNFWLATHVPMINLGYAACMVASIVSGLYVIVRLFNKNLAASDERLFLRISYGFLCAGLFLSLVGTILGGIWANDSWGRFWGWDPKENGALLIVLMVLITLHARMGGYIRDLGIHACNLLLGCVTVFSWFGTNQLGVGLHAYGFTDGAWDNIRSYWISQFILLGGIAWLKWRGKAAPAAAAEPSDLAEKA